MKILDKIDDMYIFGDIKGQLVYGFYAVKGKKEFIDLRLIEV